MILESMSKEELIALVSRFCVKVKKDYETLKAGQHYFVDQDADWVCVTDDNQRTYTFSYSEAAEILEE
jgi:hypothetical protein